MATTWLQATQRRGAGLDDIQAAVTQQDNYDTQMGQALSGGIGSREYGLMQRVESDRVKSQFGQLRMGLERDIHRRGIGRSGFAGESMSRLGAQQGSALADVAAGNTERLAEYQAQQRELGLKMQLARDQKKGNNKKKKFGTALGIAGLVLAPFTGGASLALTGAGAGMYAAG